jgi:hypothetical protein
VYMFADLRERCINPRTSSNQHSKVKSSIKKNRVSGIQNKISIIIRLIDNKEEENNQNEE